MKDLIMSSSVYPHSAKQFYEIHLPFSCFILFLSLSYSKSFYSLSFPTSVFCFFYYFLFFSHFPFLVSSSHQSLAWNYSNSIHRFEDDILFLSLIRLCFITVKSILFRFLFLMWCLRFSRLSFIWYMIGKMCVLHFMIVIHTNRFLFHISIF